MSEILLADADSNSQQHYTQLLADLDINISAHCSKGEEVIDQLKQATPDLILLSLGLEGLDALETARHLNLNYPRVPVLLQTTHGGGPFPKKLMDLGARGFVSRDTSDDELLKAIHALLAGEKYISCEIAQTIALSLLPGGEPSPLDRLSGREMQIIMQLSHGDTPQQISTRLALSPKTISTYKHRVREKLNLKDTQEMCVLTSEHGLV